MAIIRETMKFLIPLNLDALGRNDLVGRAIVPFYINPDSFSIQENKIISESLTKGGYIVQYWGEQLPEIQAAGTTGSGGIEAINILRSVYRNEITQFNNILLQRAVLLDQTARQALENTSVSSAASGLSSLLDQFTQGGFSNIISGTESVIEQITDAAQGAVDSNPSVVELIPTVGAFAVNMILYWQGEKFLGYFKNFRVDENSSKPGHFDYQFSFMVTKRSGIRTNFMPWHRSPTDSLGQPIPASTPPEGARTDELTFKTNTQKTTFSVQANPRSPNLTDSVTSVFPQEQASTQNDINRVPLSRNRSIQGK